jgi:NitT/TauT family transport system ATP-binding protein
MECEDYYASTFTAANAPPVIERRRRMTLTLEDVSVTYESKAGRDLLAIDHVSLSVADGEFVTIIGPSGCGKSTLLYCMGGMLKPTTGRITVDGQPVAKPEPRQAAFVFQDYGLFPWKDAEDNAAIGLRFTHDRSPDRRAVARRYLDLVGLKDFYHAYPGEMSGGMQQRVAVARALAMEPEVLLLDEPFGAVDEFTRRSLGIEMSTLLTEAGKSVVLITHSLEESIYWADRVVIMSPRPGQIADELVVDVPRPRRLDFMNEPGFQELRGRLMSMLNSFGANASGRGTSVSGGSGGGRARPDEEMA